MHLYFEYPANWQGLRRTQNPPSTSESDGNNNNDNINGGHGGRGSGGGGSNNNNDGGNGEGRFLRRMGFVGLLGTSYLASAQRARAEGEKQVHDTMFIATYQIFPTHAEFSAYHSSLHRHLCISYKTSYLHNIL